MTNLLKKSVARLLSCQTLVMYYDVSVENKDIDNILSTINEYYILENFNSSNGKNNYKNLFKHEFVRQLIEGVIKHQKEIDPIINKLLNKSDTTETLDTILLQCFRLAAYELKFSDLDKNIIINEYVDIVSEFYNGIYISFANGILNNLALIIRDKVDINSIVDKNKKDVNVVKKRKVITLKKNEGQLQNNSSK